MDDEWHLARAFALSNELAELRAIIFAHIAIVFAGFVLLNKDISEALYVITFIGEIVFILLSFFLILKYLDVKKKLRKNLNKVLGR
jgi:hypothetical protein